MKKFLFLLLNLAAISAFADHKVSQKVLFYGFPGNTSYDTTYTTDYDGGGGQAASSQLIKSSNDISVNIPVTFPPIDPIRHDNQQYSSICDAGGNGHCYTYFTTTINYSGKSCTVKINLKIDISPGPSSSVKHSHSNSISGDCKIVGGEGNNIWLVSPK